MFNVYFILLTQTLKHLQLILPKKRSTIYTTYISKIYISFYCKKKSLSHLQKYDVLITQCKSQSYMYRGIS